MKGFNYVDSGIQDYKSCWDYQEELLLKVVNDKRNTGKPSEMNFFILVEHPHVYTLGRSGNEKNMLIPDDFLKQINATYYRINRGGDITYHGPGQLVGYPIFDLDFHHIGVRQYIEKMEAAIMGTLAFYGLEGSRKEEATGVWLDTSSEAGARKICAIGVRVSRSVTMHGFALNVNTDLKYFDYINPCGFVTHGITSLQQELDRKVEMDEVKELIRENFNSQFRTGTSLTD